MSVSIHRYVLQCSTGRVIAIRVKRDGKNPPIVIGDASADNLNEVERGEYERWTDDIGNEIGSNLTTSEINSVLLPCLKSLPGISLPTEIKQMGDGRPRYYICHNLDYEKFDCEYQVPELGDVLVWNGDSLVLDDNIYLLLCKRFPVHHGAMFITPKGWVLEVEKPWEAADNPIKYLKKAAQKAMRKSESPQPPPPKPKLRPNQKWFSVCCGAAPIGEVYMTRSVDGENVSAVGFCQDCHDPTDFVTKEQCESDAEK